MRPSAPPREVRFARSTRPGVYLIYVPWSHLPLGTVAKRGRRWEAFTRLGRSTGVRPTRARATAALIAWTWARTPAPARVRARKGLRERSMA